MVAILSLTTNIIPSLARLSSLNVQLQEAKIALDRIYELTSTKPEFNSEASDCSLKDINSISIDNLSFRFAGRKHLLKNISLDIKKGQFTTIIGESGNGKSSLLQILQKFYDFESGQIIINDNIHWNSISPKSWRSFIGVVPQEIKLFNGNLLYNICLSNDQEDFKRVLNFCEEEGFGTYFQGFPQGYLTILGEAGVNISGGQKQLIAVARALFSQPRLLILDEPTAAMDRKTENFILTKLHSLKYKMPVLMVTHKIKTAKNSDYIYILENGFISNKGTHENLMLGNNFYSESYNEIFA